MNHTITFLRHGQSTGNVLGLIQGQSDMPLTDLGRQQAKDLASAWMSAGVRFDVILSSPLARARITAESVAAALGGPEVECDPVWMERYFGELEGRDFNEIKRSSPTLDFFDPYFAAGGGESPFDQFARAGRAVQGVLNRPAGRYLIVSHGAFLNATMLVILGLSPQSAVHSPRFFFGNTAAITVTYEASLRQWKFWSFVNTASAP